MFTWRDSQPVVSQRIGNNAFCYLDIGPFHGIAVRGIGYPAAYGNSLGWCRRCCQ